MDTQYFLRTLGCKANLYDSQLIEAALQGRGWSPAEPGSGTARLCIVNSCTVTDEADRQSRKLAARLARENPQARIVITGCAAEVDPERLSRSAGIDYVIGNRDKPELVSVILKKLEEDGSRPRQDSAIGTTGAVLGSASSYEEMTSRHPIDREWPAPEAAFSLPPSLMDGHSGKTRAFLKVQEGCNSFCTYCVIPYGRGPSRSLLPAEVLERVRKLAETGVREVVLTATNLGDYGSDWGEEDGLTALARAILRESNLERLRLSSLDPVEITPALIELMETEPRLCPHFHVSLQSPSSRILKLMKRKYGYEEVVRCLEGIAAASNRIRGVPGGIFVGMDVITGFPGETDEEFEGIRKALESLPWTRLHVFPYSEREGTPATRLPGAVPGSERARRAKELRRLSLERLEAWHEGILEVCRREGGTLGGILLERQDPKTGEVSGYTPNYVRASFSNGAGSQLVRNAQTSALPVALRVDRAGGEVSLRVVQGAPPRKG